ncbi:MAG TPA: glycerol-3-phosphate 1-O-acyltransferase PlsY [Ktedonobacteraceae bacterium]|jgi:glycerol-3-phosphate acyltransferase PlsY|nr:glycerol-3-phosphate 1-O-acyltransferase PlsY [Ktedonobacteraceae bacterium]
MPVVLQLVLDALIGYIWGSIPAGYWMGKLLKGKDFDIRAYGSHKIGATNVLRTLGKVPALIVLIFDLSKGVLPTLLATLVPALQAHIGGDAWGPTAAAIAALVGHIFPVFIGFRGGRGVMTGAGAILVISPFTFLICAITTLSTIAIWRYVSLGSIVGGLTSIVCGIVFYIIGRLDPTFFAKVTLAQLVMLVVNPALVIIFHYDNIQRLLAGTERKIGQKVELKEQATPTTSTP